MSKTPIAKALLKKEDPYKTDVKMGHHVLISDEPESNNGTDQGPDPVRLTLGALASCTAMTLKMYILRKGWDFDDIQVDIYYQVDRVRDPDDISEDEKPYIVNGRIRRITKEILIEGDFDDKQLKRLYHISGKCPVNLMLKGNCKITDKIKTGVSPLK